MITVGLAAVTVEEVATRDKAEGMESDVREGDEVGDCDFSKGVVAVIAVSAGLESVRASLRGLQISDYTLSHWANIPCQSIRVRILL